MNTTIHSNNRAKLKQYGRKKYTCGGYMGAMWWRYPPHRVPHGTFFK